MDHEGDFIGSLVLDDEIDIFTDDDDEEELFNVE